MWRRGRRRLRHIFGVHTTWWLAAVHLWRDTRILPAIQAGHPGCEFASKNSEQSPLAPVSPCHRHASQYVCSPVVTFFLVAFQRLQLNQDSLTAKNRHTLCHRKNVAILCSQIRYKWNVKLFQISIVQSFLIASSFPQLDNRLRQCIGPICIRRVG